MQFFFSIDILFRFFSVSVEMNEVSETESQTFSKNLKFVQKLIKNFLIPFLFKYEKSFAKFATIATERLKMSLISVSNKKLFNCKIANLTFF